MSNTADTKLTAEEVGGELRVNAATVNSWARCGSIRASKVGRRWLFDRADVEAHFTARTNAPQPTTVTRRKRRR